MQHAQLADHRLNGTAAHPPAAEPDPDGPLLVAATSVLEYVRTGQGIEAVVPALAGQANDPRPAVRDAIHLLAADIRPAAPDRAKAEIDAMLARVSIPHLRPGDVARQLDALAREAQTQTDKTEALRRFAVATRRQLRQTTPVTRETIADLVTGIGKCDPEALAAADQHASERGPVARKLTGELVRGTKRTTRPEWKAACDASLTALDIFKRLEPLVPAAAPWWKSKKLWVAVGVLGVALGLGMLIGARLFRPVPAPQEPNPIIVVAAPEKAPPAPTPPAVAGVKRVVVITPTALATGPAGLELTAQVDALMHGAGIREKDKPAPPTVEVVPYASLPAAAWLPPDCLTGPGVEPVLSRMLHMNLLAGADHVAVVRPLRQEGTGLVAAVTLIKLSPPPAPPGKDAPPAPPWVEVNNSVRVWSDVWHLAAAPTDWAAQPDRRRRRLAVVAVDHPDRGRLAAETLWRQPDATAADFVTAAAYYLAAGNKAPEATARARELLWAGYTRFGTDDLARFLIGIDGLPNRMALAAAHPGVLTGLDRDIFLDPKHDESHGGTRADLVAGWAKKLLAEVPNDRR